MRARWTLAAFVLLAWALRLIPALVNRFHPDEALYGYWGLLIANWRDPWLVGVPVYKPPLLPYLIAGSQGVFGNFECSVRLPGLAAGLLTVPLTAALSHVLYRDRWAAVTAAACVALSPFAILFSATAFTDPPMVTLGMGACVAAARGRAGWAGLLAGLAFAAKQTGLAWLPLALGLLLVRDSEPKVQVPRLAAGFTAVAVGMFAWDAARVAQGAESFWGLGVGGYGGLRLIWPQELWGRLEGWGDVARYLFVSPLADGLLVTGLPILVWRALTRFRRTREALVDLLLVTFLSSYALLHWLWAFPVWDRYLLPMLPLLCVLLGRLLTRLSRYACRQLARLWPAGALYAFPAFSLAVVVSLLAPAWNAALYSYYPVGGDHGAYDGIDRVAVFMNDLPEGTVVYQHWLGWEYSYYLFGGPVSLAYWPTPAWLARDVQVFGAKSPRYIAFPSWESSARVEHALAGVGYGLEPVLATTRRDGAASFTVYRVRQLADSQAGVDHACPLADP